MHIEQHVKLWNMASIKIWDVRHVVMQADEEVIQVVHQTSQYVQKVV